MEGNQRLEDHIKSDEERFGFVGRNIELLRKDVDNIKDNHLQHIQNSIMNLSVDVGSVKSDLEWLKKSHWVIVTASIMSLLSLVVGILLFFVEGR